METTVLQRAHAGGRARFLTEFATWQQFAEDLISLGNGWLLLLSTGVSLVALMLDVRAGGAAALAWALAQVFGVDLQFVASGVRAHSAWSQRQYGVMLAWSIMAIALGVAIWQATYAYSVENATGVTEAQVFQQLGMSLTTWLGWRAFLLVLLLFVAAITRHSRTVTDAHLAAAAGTTTGGSGPSDGGQPQPLPFARATVPATQAPEAPEAPEAPGKPRKDPRTARTASASAQLRAQREAFAQLWFQQNPQAGPTGLARALGIKPGATVQRLWERYGQPQAAAPLVVPVTEPVKPARKRKPAGQPQDTQSTHLGVANAA